jgi:pSer/pThr/pTyr-binding forkhead associated (FHA) protein
MSMATLYQIGKDGAQAEEWELSERPVVVGRSGQAEVHVEDDGLSRRHFAIVREGEDYLIKDLNSRNGTWVRGRRVSTEKLRHNDLILAGHTRFRFAAPPYFAAAASQPQTGPHGTVIVPAIRMQSPESAQAAA